MTVRVTFPLDEAEKAELDRIAASEDIPLERLLTRLVKQRLDHERWMRGEIAKGERSAASEPLLDHAEVFAALDRRLAGRRRRR